MIFKHITLETNKPEQLYHFYQDILGLPVYKTEEDSFTIPIGHSKLTFRKKDTEAYYHFALNVPSFRSKDTLEWLKRRVIMIPDEGEEIIPFKNWNAETMYFKDPAGNIVEFIARKNLALPYNGRFSAMAIQGISEIGIVTQDVEAMYKAIAKHLAKETGRSSDTLDRYWGSFRTFGAAGDEQGLFIIVKEEAKKWFPTRIPSKPFPVEVILEYKGKKIGMKFQ